MYSHREDFPTPAKGRQSRRPFTIEQWKTNTFADKETMQWFCDARYGMFIHFGLSTYKDLDLSWGVCSNPKAPDIGGGPYPEEEWTQWANEFRLEKFDAREWVALAKRAQFKYLVLITKHHDGFHMWDTAQSDFKITNTPFGRDLVKEVIDACHEADMPVGLYYSQRDWHHPDYMPVDPDKVTRDGIHWTLKPGYDSPIGESHARYLEYQEQVVRELCTKYGKIDIFWWDAAWCGGMFTAEMWDSDRINRLIRELQPDIIINNRCSLPGDFDTPEQQLGAFQNWRPWESCISLSKTWSYSGTEIKSLEKLIHMVVSNICGDGNILLSWGPHWDGEFDGLETSRLIEMGEWLKTNAEAISGTRGGPWKPASWGGSVYRGNTIYLHITSPMEELVLPALPQCNITAAALLSGKPVTYSQSKTDLKLTMPCSDQQPCDIIVALTVDEPVQELAPIEGETQ
jgi:alpha-L-fucosidase